MLAKIVWRQLRVLKPSDKHFIRDVCEERFLACLECNLWLCVQCVSRDERTEMGKERPNSNISHRNRCKSMQENAERKKAPGHLTCVTQNWQQDFGG